MSLTMRLGLALILAALPSPAAGQESEPRPGRGLFQKLHREQREALTVNIDSPYLSGSEARWFWGELEPEEGKFAWGTLDEFLRMWGAAGKKVIVNLSTCQKQAPEATPKWVFLAGARRIAARAPDKFEDHPDKKTKTFPESDYPVYWDSVYLEKYSAFIRALGKRYNGHPALEAIEMGLGHNTGFAIAPFEELLDEYRKQATRKWSG